MFRCDSGEVFIVDVEEGVVVDEHGEEVEGVEVWRGQIGNNTCGIEVMEKGEDGDWMCQVGDDMNLGAVITMEDEVTVNLRLPTNVKQVG